MRHSKPLRHPIDNFVPSGRPLTPDFERQKAAFPAVGATLSTYRGNLAPAQPSLLGGVAVDEPKKLPWYRRWSKKRIAFIVLLPLLIVGVWLGVKFAFNLSRIFHGNILGIFSTTQLKGEDQGRVNILLAGNSADDPGHNGANLTDSIMILSIDTRNHTAFMLSIPRDLYVNIPNYGHAKINEAYVAGEQQHFNSPGYPAGGMGLLEEVVEQNLGIKSQYYALVNYAALRDAVNAVGGIQVTINSSNPHGLYDPSIDWTTHGPLVKLTNGVHTLDGREALDLARARGDAPGSYGFGNADFTRTQNQRIMMLALKSKMVSSGVLANPLKLNQLFDSLGRNVRSDMTLSEARRAYDIMHEISNSQIKSYGLNDLDGVNYLKSYRAPNGASALIPAAGVDTFTDIQHALQRITSNNPIVREDATVVVLNATEITGIASKAQTQLIAQNMNVVAVGDANSSSASSYIINNVGATKPATLKALQTIYGQHVTTTNPYAGRYHADFIIVIGTDHASTE